MIVPLIEIRAIRKNVKEFNAGLNAKTPPKGRVL